MNRLSETTLRGLATAFVIGALLAFMLAAAASAIVVSANEGSAARQTEFAANQIVAAAPGEAVKDVPPGARVLALSDVSAAALTAGAPHTPDEGANLVTIGNSTADVDAFLNALNNWSQKWAEVANSPEQRIRAAATDIGVRLRSHGYDALLLPRNILGSPYACTIASGLFAGGLIPIFRFPNADATQQRKALASCIRANPRKVHTVLVDMLDGSGYSLARQLTRHHVTLLFRTKENAIDVSLASGASAVLVNGVPRSQAIDSLVSSAAHAGDRQTIIAASLSINEWVAAAPPAGESPPTARKERAARRKVRRLKNPTFSPETGSRVGENRGGTRDTKGQANPAPAPRSKPPPNQDQGRNGQQQTGTTDGGARPGN